jgi:hypothetical protein
MSNNDIALIICTCAKLMAGLCIEAAKMATTDLPREDRRKALEEMERLGRDFEDVCTGLVEAIQKVEGEDA